MHAPKRSLAFYSGPWNFTVVIEVFGFCIVKYEILTVAPKRPVVFIQQNTNFWILCPNGHSFYGNSFFDYEMRNTKMDIPFLTTECKISSFTQATIRFFDKKQRKQNLTRNAARCNDHDDLLHLSFIWKISIFSETYLEPAVEHLWRNSFVK